MTDYYLLTLQQKKKGYMDLYKETMRELLGEELSWKEVQALDRDTLRKLTFLLEDKIKITESPIDIEKLARAIQYSRSGIGGSAMTPYTCHFCGEEDWWGNTAVPNICLSCARKMARNIVLSNTNILKDGVVGRGT